MKKLIHNILAVMLVVVMVIMSFGNQSVLPISIVNANESEIVYPFGYKSSDLFVADAILGQANGLDFTNISSMPILHNFLHFPAPSLRGHKYIIKLKSTKTLVCLSI